MTPKACMASLLRALMIQTQMSHEHLKIVCYQYRLCTTCNGGNELTNSNLYVLSRILPLNIPFRANMTRRKRNVELGKRIE